MDYWPPTARAVSIQAKAAVIGSAVITAAIATTLRSSSMTRLTRSNRSRNTLLLFGEKLLPVGGGNLVAPLNSRIGDNLSKGSCHRSHRDSLFTPLRTI